MALGGVPVQLESSGKGRSPGLCASCSSSDFCLFIQQQMAASASHADRLSVTGRNGQISAAQPFRRTRSITIHCSQPTDTDSQLGLRVPFDISSSHRLTESRITETKERLLEATRQRKHAKPAGLHSEAKQTQNYNKERGISGRLSQVMTWGG